MYINLIFLKENIIIKSVYYFIRNKSGGKSVGFLTNKLPQVFVLQNWIPGLNMYVHIFRESVLLGYIP